MKNERPSERLLSTAEAARLCAVDVSTIRRYADRGTLPTQRLPSGVRRFRREDVERLLTPSSVTA